MKRKNCARILALLAALLILAAVCYVAAEAGHDCPGEACCVCLRIRLCESAVALLVPGALLCALFPHAVFSARFAPILRPAALCGATPVSRKVKLSD